MTDQQLRAIAREMLRRGGGFRTIGSAYLQADELNGELMRPLMLSLIAKYPQYPEMAQEEEGARQ